METVLVDTAVEENFVGMSLGEAMDAAEHPTMRRTAPTPDHHYQKELPTPKFQ